MKKTIAAIAITLALAGSAFASSKTQLDEYCINISDFADKRDALTNAVEAAGSVTDEEQEPNHRRMFPLKELSSSRCAMMPAYPQI